MEVYGRRMDIVEEWQGKRKFMIYKHCDHHFYFNEIKMKGSSDNVISSSFK